MSNRQQRSGSLPTFIGDCWYALSSAQFQQRAVHWGVNGDIPVPGDYDGGGKLPQTSAGFGVAWRRVSTDIPIEIGFSPQFVDRQKRNSVYPESRNTGPFGRLAHFVPKKHGLRQILLHQALETVFL